MGFRPVCAAIGYIGVRRMRGLREEQYRIICPGRMTTGRPGVRYPSGLAGDVGRCAMRKRIFFICGSMNQTTQMHQISKHLREYEHSFSPYYCDGFDEILRRLGLMEFTIIGEQAGGTDAGRICRIMTSPSTTRGRIGPTTWWLPARTCTFRRTFETTGSCWFRRGLRTRNPFCFVSSSVSDSFLAGWRVHRRPVSAMHTGLSASQARDIAISSSEKA